MAVTIRNATQSTPLDRSARYRITWRVVAAPLVPDSTIDTHRMATELQKALPALGIIPVSAITAVDGDPFIQFRTQLSQTFPGYTVADLIQQANRLPLLNISSLTSLRTALDVSEVEVYQSGAGALNEIAEDVNAYQRAKTAATAADIATTAASGLRSFFGGLSDIAKFALVVAGVVAIGYVVVRYRR